MLQCKKYANKKTKQSEDLNLLSHLISCFNEGDIDELSVDNDKYIKKFLCSKQNPLISLRTCHSVILEYYNSS